MDRLTTNEVSERITSLHDSASNYYRYYFPVLAWKNLRFGHIQITMKGYPPKSKMFGVYIYWSTYFYDSLQNKFLSTLESVSAENINTFYVYSGALNRIRIVYKRSYIVKGTEEGGEGRREKGEERKDENLLKAHCRVIIFETSVCLFFCFQTYIYYLILNTRVWNIGVLILQMTKIAQCHTIK